MEAKALTDAIAKLQSAHWHMVHNTVNGGLVDGLVHDAVNLLEPRMHSERLAAAHDAQMERLKACEHIADGDDGWEKLEHLCPSTAAVARLRARLKEAQDRRDEWCAAYTELRDNPQRGPSKIKVPTSPDVGDGPIPSPSN